MATTLLPFRDYDEHDVINLFAVDGELTKGHMVMINNGWKSDDEMTFLNEPGAAFGNTVSERYGVTADVVVANGASADVLGILLYDVKETDENGEKLVFNPRKAAELEIALSGQAVPIATRGVFLYSGTQLIADAPAAGANLYHTTAGELTTTDAGTYTKVGKTLGAKDANGAVLVKIEL